LVVRKQSHEISADHHTNDLRQRLARFSNAYSVDISTIITSDAQRWLDGLKLGTQTG